VAIVTMDSHGSAAMTRAAARARADIPGLVVTLHTADSWENPDALASCHEAIAEADIVLASMLFLDAHVAAVLPALRARRESCDAMIAFLAAGEVTRLTRIGRFDMGRESSGLLSLLKRLRGARNAQGASNGERQMAMLRQLPKLLRFIPGSAQDVRAYFLAMQYWLAGSEENLADLLRLLVGRFAQGPRKPATPPRTAPPRIYPDVGLYHPRLSGRIGEDLSALPSPKSAAGRVGVLLMRSYVLAGNAAHYDGVITELEAQGLAVVPAFAAGLDARPAIARYFTKDGRATVDAVVSLTGFSLVGGPAYNDARAAESVLADLDVPYIAAHPVEFQSLAQWRDDARGLTPVEATMMVAIPELDGAIMPTMFGGRDAGSEARTMAAESERATTLAARVARLVTLRRKPQAERRVAMVLFNFPPNAGATGTAAYLSVFASLFNMLRALRDAGYTVDVPADVDALRERVLGGNAALHGAPANVAAHVATETHLRRETHLAEIERAWGPAPGRHQVGRGGIQILGARFGNVFIGIQPAFGYEGDPMRLLFEHGFAPTHAFNAFYRWLREDLAADAVLHVGTHGALEFMPGKQSGLSAACWPDRLIGELPNFYLYASNNPSEGLLAKRRAGATLISYLTPPVAHAGLYRGLLDLKATLDRWRAAAQDDRRTLASVLQAQAAAVDLAPAEPSWTDPEAAATALVGALHELETTLIPHGLHVVGEPPCAEARAVMLDAAGIADTEVRARMERLLGEDHELPALLHALDGGYIRPVPGGDLLRTPEVLPTGRNLHGFDPFRLPSAFALTDGAAQAARLLERHLQDTGKLPETIAIVLWGTDNLKSEGGPIAQALAMMGTAPRFDSYGRLAGARLLPLAELGRPRIDVVATLSGIFRDLLPLQTKLLAEAALLAAEADEDPEQNFIRKHALAFVAKHGGSMTEAALRVFGNAEGAYGANVNLTLDHGAWGNEDELAEIYVRRKGFSYGADGRARAAPELLAHTLATVELTYQNLDSIELGVTTIDTYFDTLGGISGAVRRARGQAIPVYIGDQTRGAGAVRTLDEQVALETRTRTLNPAWYEPLLAHGHEGVRSIEAHVTNTLGWSATTGQVQPWVYQQLAQTYVLDEAMRRRLAALNPIASTRIASRLIEAQERRYWQPSEDTLAALHQARDELEDRMEGIMEQAA
jgi:magnesium chelatase subunit H